mmetsp:Transcript_11181/g.16903  ORF Transcript_11181/g.16903 Transcript_11181/m.16903 type:complete len:212 (-) Transcript_11181:62-697(-)
MVSLFYLLAADALSPEQAKEWQSRLMYSVYEELSDDAKRRGMGQFKDPCRWAGVTCLQGTVDRIDHRNWDFGLINIFAAPPSTKTIWLFRCKQRRTLPTRSLPKKLTTLSLSCNLYFGPIDLVTLPPKLASAFLWDNHLEGPLDMRLLPKSLTRLDLQRNRIRQDVVCYDNLPPRLTRIDLSENRVNEVHPLSPKETANVKSIFKGVKYVH